jgi:hypothetical protein
MNTYILSGEWLGVDLRTGTKKTRVEKRLKMQVHNVLTILDTIISCQNLEETDMVIQGLGEFSLRH